jgi:hypothetical protein
MIKAMLLASILALFSTTANAAYPRCYIENGVAHMFFCSDKNEHGSGTGVVRIYDKHRINLGSKMVIWVGIAMGECDEVDRERVPEQAKYCRFQFSKDGSADDQLVDSRIENY